MLLNTTLYGQEAIQLTYEVVFTDKIYLSKNSSEETNNYLKRYYKQQKEIIEGLSFTLQADDQYYTFTYQTPFTADQIAEYTLIGGLSRTMDGNFISADKKENIAMLGGFPTISEIDRKIDMNDIIWEETSERKQILNKECFMAIGRLKSENAAHKTHYPIKAWYCPSIPIACGPTPFATLPGAILELENDDVIITANSINALDQKVRPLDPNYKIMSYPEFKIYTTNRAKKSIPKTKSN